MVLDYLKLEGEAEERRRRGAEGWRRQGAAARGGGRRRGRRGGGAWARAWAWAASSVETCVLWGSPAHVYKGGASNPTRSLSETY